MTDAELQTLETQLGIRLPSDYIRHQRDYPLDATNPNAAIALLSDLQDVLSWNGELREGEHSQDWRAHWFAIGWSPVGDTFFLDLSDLLNVEWGEGGAIQGNPSAVFGWDHETHAVYDVASSLDAFVAEIQASRSESGLTATQRQWQSDQAKRMRMGLWVVVAILIVCLLVPVVLGLVIYVVRGTIPSR